MPYTPGAPANVVAYSGSAYSGTLDIKIECTVCHTEWGWARDVPSDNDKLEALAESHNREVHGWEPADWRDLS